MIAMVEEGGSFVVRIVGWREIEKQWRRLRCGGLSVIQVKM
jgi:hypothetical protein